MSFWDNTKVTVSSFCYNLAGDVAGRPNFLKTVTIGAALNHDNSRGIGETLKDSYFSGPGMKLRSFGRWADYSGFDTLIGALPSDLSVTDAIDPIVLAAVIPHGTSEEVVLQNYDMGLANYNYWADRYMADVHPSQVDTDYTYTFDSGTKNLTITLADGSQESFIASDFDVTKQYLYVAYFIRTGGTSGTLSSIKVLIYAKGSGNLTYDAFFTDGSSGGRYIPFIPVRLNNAFISSTNLPTVYEKSKRALKKATGIKFDTLVSKISDNSSLSEIDYAFVVFGASFNTADVSAKRYIYQFFKEIYDGLIASNAQFQTWLTAYLSGSTPIPTAPTTNLRIASSSSTMNYDMTISWAGMAEVLGSGVARVGAKAGDIWFETGDVTINTAQPGATPGTIVNYGVQDFRTTLWWQETDTSWRRITIYDMYHANRIYGGNSAITWAKAALDSADESGFIIPIHEEIFSRLPITKSTQLSMSCCYLVFNCYTVVKAKWYETGFFKFVFVVGVIAISVFTGGLGTVGLLGSSVEIGTALGATGLLGAIIGTAANAIAAMVFIALIQQGSTLLFGEKWGAIVGAVFGFIAMNMAVSMMNGFSMIDAFDSLLKVDNLLKLTNSISNGVSEFMKAEVQEISQKTTDVVTDYNKQSKEISAAYSDLVGVDRGEINPLDFVNVSLPTVSLGPERPQVFLDRTLMVGSDIASMSFDLINSFADLMLNLDLDLNRGTA